jgi:hypothetical protein
MEVPLVLVVACWQRYEGRDAGAIGGGQHGPDRVPVKRHPGQDPGRLRPAHRGPVRPRLAERVEGVGRSQQAGGGVQAGTGHPGRVAAPVGPLVMTAGDLAQRRQHR